VIQAGRVISIQGPIVEVKFAPSSVLPAVHEILETHTHDGQKVVLEVEEHLEAYLTHLLERRLNSPRFLRQVQALELRGDRASHRAAHPAGDRASHPAGDPGGDPAGNPKGEPAPASQGAQHRLTP